MNNQDKQIQARRRIKKHLKIKGDDMLEVTPALVLYWWHVLNNALFYGILNPPSKIHCRNFRSESEGWVTYGWCMPDNYNTVEIGIRRQFDNRKQFLITLTHEMVHQYEMETLGKMSHGQSFYEWEPTIKRLLNLPLTEYVE